MGESCGYEDETKQQSQFGSMPSRNKHDRCDFHTATDSSEKYRQGQKNIRVTFIDLKKAHDSMPRNQICRKSALG